MSRRFKMTLMLVAAFGQAWAVEQPPSIHAGPVYSSLTEFPAVHVLVDVPPGTAKGLLEPRTFALRVDSGPAATGQKVQTLAETGFGMAAVVMLDVSGSMIGGPLNAIRAGLVKFASQAGVEDRVAITTVADETRWESNWNDPPDRVRLALERLKSRGRLTRLWDGMVDVLGKYPETPAARRLIVISDGHDEGSGHPLDDVIAAAVKQHIAVDSIGLTRSNPKHLANLSRLSDSTGGLSRVAESLTMLEKLVGSGIERYRGMPVVTFNMTGVSADGKAHPFEVAWKSNGADLQSRVDSQVPEDPKLTAAAVAKVDPPPVEAAAVQTSSLPDKLAALPKMYVMIGGGVVVLVLLLVAFLVLRKSKRGPTPPAPRPAPQFQQGPPPQYQQQPPYFQPPFQQPPQSAPPLTTGAFGQVPMPPSAPPPGGSVFQPLTAEFMPPAALTPANPAPSWAPEPRLEAPSKARPSAWLAAVDGPVAGRSFPVDEAQFWIGANPNNHLRLENDPTVSGNHACIVFEQQALAVYDNHSTNGLYLNGERLSDVPRILKPGDQLRVGRTTFVVQPPSS